VRCIAFQQDTLRFGTNTDAARRRKVTATPKETAHAFGFGVGMRFEKELNERFLSESCPSGKGGGNTKQRGAI
jgi:hypothetical protein